jgi:hypothetical protein
VRDAFQISHSVDWIELPWDEVLIDVIQRAVRVSPEWSKIIAAVAMPFATPSSFEKCPGVMDALSKWTNFDQL